MSIDPDRQQADRRNLADVLREVRRAAGLSGERLAARCGISQSKISRIETGRTLPSVSDVDRILSALAVPSDQARSLLDMARAANVDYTSGRAVARLGLDHRQREVIGRIESARFYRQFLPAIPPGFLQIRQYAERVMAPVVPSAPARDVAKAVRARMEMRSVLDDESRRFMLLITEPAVRWNLAGTDVGAQQIAHLAREAARPNVEIGVIRQATQVPKAPVNMFSIVDERLVTVELFNGVVTFRDPREVMHYVELFEFFYSHALTGDDAVEFLKAVADEFRSR